MTTTEEEVREFLFKQGDAQRRKVLGDEHVERSNNPDITPFALSAQKLATEGAWGTIWTRPGLTPAQRSTVTLTLLATMGKQTELAVHTKGALRNGLSELEIQEILLQVMVYAGMPTGLEAFRTVDDAIQKYDAELKEKEKTK